MDAHVEVATPCLFKMTACSVLKTPCSRTNLQGKLRSYYHGIRYVDKIDNKTLDVSDLPPDWFAITREDGGATLFRKCEVKVNGYCVVEHIHIDDKGRITLQIGPNTIDPAQVGLPSNFYETILPLHDTLSIVESRAMLCLGKEVAEEFSNITITLPNGNKHHGRKSKLCFGYVPLTSRGRLCPKCLSVNITQFKTNSSDDSINCNIEESSGHEPHESIIPESVLYEYFPDCPDLLTQLIRFQSKCLWDLKNGKDGRCHRWPKSIISFAISLFITSPRSYRLISTLLYMPSESLIKKYKNNLEKDPGINHNFIQWMYKELDRTESPKIGGLIFDEMTIQSGVHLQPEGEGLAMTGFVDFEMTILGWVM